MPELTTSALGTDWSVAIRTTWWLMGVSALIAAVLGIPAAFCASLLAEGQVSRGDDRTGKLRLGGTLIRFWQLAMLMSISLPLILHAAAWETAAGKFGWLIKTMTGGNLLWVGWIHGLHGACLVALATFWGTQRIAPTVMNHARMDFGLVAQWWRVRLPLAIGPSLAAVLGVLVLAATEMSVADLHSVRTVADQFYLFYALDPNATAIAATTWIPMLVGLPPVLVWLWGRRQRVEGGLAWTSSGDHRQPDDANDWESESLGATGLAAAWSGLGITSLLMLLVPVMGLVVQAGHTVVMLNGSPSVTWSLSACLNGLAEALRVFADEYAWTMQLSLFTATLVLPIAWCLARSTRKRQRFAFPLDALATGLFLIPGPVVGMAIAQVFTGNVPVLEKLATETLVPTMLAVSVRSGVVAYVILRVGYMSLDASTWDAARLDGGTIWRVWKIERPLLSSHLVVAWLAACIVVSGDVPAAMAVLPPGVSTVGSRLFGLLHSGARYQEASLAFWYLVGVVGLSGAVYRIARR